MLQSKERDGGVRKQRRKAGKRKKIARDFHTAEKKRDPRTQRRFRHGGVRHREKKELGVA